MYGKCNKILTHLNSLFTHCCLTYTHIIIEQNTFENKCNCFTIYTKRRHATSVKAHSYNAGLKNTYPQ
jgi:hypothetical protein